MAVRTLRAAREDTEVLRKAHARDRILRVVMKQLESRGHDALALRDVARRARVSLATIYKLFPMRDALIVAAVGRWMEENCYSNLKDPPSDASLFEGQMWFFRRLFEPWERCPRMLEAYHRATSGPGGEKLGIQGFALVDSVGRSLLDDLDPDYAKDFRLIMANMVCGVIQRCAAGEIPAAEILPVIERTLFRLTTDNEAALAARGARRLGRKGGRVSADRRRAR